MNTSDAQQKDIRPARSPYVVPLSVLIIMLMLTLVAGAYRVSISPALDRGIQSLPLPVFLFCCLMLSLGVFAVLVRYVRGRERIVAVLLAAQHELEAQHAELRAKNKQLMETTQSVTAQGSDRLKQLEESRTAMVSLLEDLTESRDRIEAAVAFDDAMLASLDTAVIVYDTAGRIQRINAAAERLLGKTGDAVVGKFPDDVYRIVDDAGTLIPFAARPAAMVLSEGATATAKQARGLNVKQADGRVVPIEISASPVIMAGKLRAVVVLARDVTEQRRIDRSKSEFVSLASHQLRTPLTAISWFAELLEGEVSQKLNDQEREYLHEIYQANKRMIELVDALLNVSRIEMGTVRIEPEPVDLVQYIRDEVGVLLPIADAKRITIRTDIGSEIPSYAADRKILGILLQNILSNAVKYTPSSGSISVSLRRGEDGTIAISIADSGIGIPAEVQPRVFEKLFRADNAQQLVPEGSGLGLYLVKSLVEQIGGSISFRSELGKGTTFTLTLPPGGMKTRGGAHVAGSPSIEQPTAATLPQHG